MRAMVPEIKAKWLEALRSGEYEQGAGYLKREHIDEATGNKVQAFCCLGVLSDITYKAGVFEHVEDTNSGCTIFDGETAYLPKSVSVWSGINDCGDFPGRETWPGNNLGSYTSLIEANDDGKSFEEIADIIEELF